MWLFKFLYCLCRGHAASLITADGRDYRYCHRCGSVMAVKTACGEADGLASLQPGEAVDTLRIPSISR